MLPAAVPRLGGRFVPVEDPLHRSANVEPARRSRADRWLLILAPVVVGVVFGGVLVLERGRVDTDLLLLCPNVVEAGRPMPARAWMLHGVGSPADELRPESPRPVELSLAVDGRVIARARLAPSSRLGAEGSLDVPSDLAGGAIVLAEARSSAGGVLRVSRRVEVREALERPASLVERPATDLRRLELGPVTAPPGTEPPSELDVRAADGPCVPEIPCPLLVWVGEPAASITIEGDALAAAPAASALTAAIATIPVLVRATEAVIEAHARRGDVDAGRRTVRLPLALGAPRVEVEPTLAREATSHRARATTIGGTEPLLLDVFVDDVWRFAGSIASDGTATIPSLGPGLHRFVVHAHPSIDESAAETLAFVSGGADPLPALASMLARRYPDAVDPAILGVGDGDPTLMADPEASAALLLAPHASFFPTMPNPMRSYEQAAVGVHQRIGAGRIAAALVVLLAGLALSSFVLRRGLRANEEARALLLASGLDEAGDPSRERRMALVVLACAVVLFGAFVAIAVMIVVRDLGAS